MEEFRIISNDPMVGTKLSSLFHAKDCLFSMHYVFFFLQYMEAVKKMDSMYIVPFLECYLNIYTTNIFSSIPMKPGNFR